MPPADDARALVAFADAFDQCPSVWIIYEGPDLVVVAAGQAARELFGNPLVGLTMQEALVQRCGQQAYEFCRSVYDTGSTLRQARWRLTFDVPDGLQERWFDVVVAPIRAADGTITGVNAQGFDVTEEVLAHRRTQARADRNEAGFRASQVVVAQLQRAMLPQRLPVLPRLAVSARYLVAEAGQLAGGDWFDVLPLDDGSVALIVGDVVGHGVAASIAMGQLRTVLTSLLLDGVPLDAALRRVERFAASTPGVRAATAVVAVLEPMTGRLSYATCGHPPVLVVSRSGATRYLPLSGGGPLGLGSAAPLAAEQLVAGDVLVLYTDGLIERPGQNLEAGLSNLAAVASDAVTRRLVPRRPVSNVADAVCQLATEQLVRDAGRTDDLTILAVGLQDRAPGELRFVLPAQPASLVRTRETLDRWLVDLGLRGADQTEIMLLMTEAFSNAIEHAYVGCQPGDVAVTARLLNDGIVALTISDRGTWRVGARDLGSRGHGLSIMEQLTDDLNVIRRPDGTVVELWYRLTSPVDAAMELFTSSHLPHLHSALAVRVEQGEAATILHCSGTIDASTAGDLQLALSRARSGERPVLVDLTSVQLLASAGIEVLLSRSTNCATLIAAPGSPARVVLDLVSSGRQVLDHAPEDEPV